MAFLPDGSLLVTERPTWDAAGGDNAPVPGALRVVTPAGAVSAPLVGLPDNVGLLDVLLDPSFASNRRVLVTMLEMDKSAARVGRAAGDANYFPVGLVLAEATLDTSGTTPVVRNARVLWRQAPKITTYPGSGEPGGRMAFSSDGAHLFVTAGDRQEYANWPQELGNTIGKTIRLLRDGSVPTDNPFSGRMGALGEIWSLGHRNPYGLAFDASGRLWQNEMGPMGGDELNVVTAGANYGWPLVSNGQNYDGSDIPDHKVGDGFAAPALSWTPVIAPSGMIIYSATRFESWRGNAIISGLASKGLVRVRLDGVDAKEVERIDLGTRIRAVAQGPDGAIWVLEDRPSARLIRLDPVF
jgi:glucose/arabinose dehydrogenase